jgi:hypothetical protein
MADDPNKRGARDRARIATEQEHEVRYWTKRFGVSRAELERVVRLVGPSVSAVEKRLNGRKRGGVKKSATRTSR